MIIDSSWYKKPDGVPDRISAGGIIIRMEQNTPLVALIQEGDYSEYLIPKGGVENNETLEQAAWREIQEEAGLTDLTLITEMGVRERLDIYKKTWSITHYFLFTTKQEEGNPTELSKSYRLSWFPFDTLPTFFWPEQEALLTEKKEWILSKLYEQ